MKQLPDVTFANNSLVVMFQGVSCITPASNAKMQSCTPYMNHSGWAGSWHGRKLICYLVWIIWLIYIFTSSSVEMWVVVARAQETLITKVNISHSVFFKELYVCLVVIILWCSSYSCIRMISLTHFPIEKVCMETLHSVCY